MHSPMWIMIQIIAYITHTQNLIKTDMPEAASHQAGGCSELHIMTGWVLLQLLGTILMTLGP